MKTNEIVQEGPLDFAKRAVAGVKGAMAPTSDFRTGYQQAGEQQKLQDMVKRTYPAWNQAVVAYKNQQLPEPEIAKRMKTWTEKYFGIAGMPPYPEAMITAQGAQKYLLNAVSRKMTGEQPAQQPAQQPAAEPAAQTQEPAQQPAAPAAQTQQPAAPAQDPTHAMFKDPNAFKAEWDKFVAANQNYKLIADPKLLSVLKTMWMRSGGMKAESKKNKGKRV